MFNQHIIFSIRDQILQRKETIAVAESVTSGLVQAAFATAPDASQFYQGGITAYNIGQKYRHLLVEPIHAQSCNCVSDQVAVGMALNVCGLFSSDWGLGITGYAVPAPESGNQLFAYYAIAYKGRLLANEKITVAEGLPMDVQIYYVNHLLETLNNCLKKVIRGV
jgi:nicotinamide-nucleotide amidase